MSTTLEEGHLRSTETSYGINDITQRVEVGLSYVARYEYLVEVYLGAGFPLSNTDKSKNSMYGKWIVTLLLMLPLILV
jgi:hypothetical protein